MSSFVPRRFALCVTLFSCTLFSSALFCSAGVMADPRQAWEEPFSITLPEPPRSIVLQAGQEPQAWLVANGLTSTRVQSRGKLGSVVEVPMSDARWEDARDGLCLQPEVAACEDTVCQTIQLTGDVATDGRNAESVQARLVRNAPEQVPEAETADADAGSCRGPALIPPLAPAETPAGVNLSLDLSQLDDGGGRSASGRGASERGASGTQGGVSPSEGSARSGNSTASVPDEGTGEVADVVADSGAAEEGSSEAAEADATDPASSAAVAGTDTDATAVGDAAGDAGAADAGTRSFEFSVGSSALGAAGGASLSADQLPADTSDYTLVVGASCVEVKVPLDAVAPARAPGLVLALVDPGAVAAVAGAYGLTVVRQISLDTTGENLVVYATPGSVAGVIAQLAQDARVVGPQAEFVYRTSAVAGAPGGGGGANGYSDPFAALTYGPRKSGALGLHHSVEGASTTVAVIDTGVAVDHPEFSNRIEAVDVTDKGWSADAHGTAVAGIIAAAANNAVGSYGVAPEARLLAIKACQPREEGGLSARCWTSTLVKALDVAMSKDAAVINMSLTGPPDDLVERYVQLALEQDRLIVAGSGNGGPHAKPGFPAALPGVLAVTAVDVNDRLFAAANVGDYIDIAAPGVDIVSPIPDGLYPPLSGTSMAAAHVSGVAVLIFELVPVFGGREIAQVLISSSRDLGEPGPDALYGRGMVDACATAQQATAQAVSCDLAAVESPGESDD